MNAQEEKVIADGFFKVFATAYKHGVLDKYFYITGRAQAEAADEIGLRIGDMLNAFNEMGMESVQRGEAALQNLVPFLDVLASDALWAAISRLLDNQFVQQWLWERERKALTGVAKNPLKENITSMIVEILQLISANPEEKARVARMFEIILQMIGSKSKSALKEAV